jgi:hypothetical protein
MNEIYFRESGSRKHSGIAGIAILLLGIGLLAILYMLYTTQFNPFAAFHGKEKDRYSDPNAKPWEESHLFIFEALDGYDMGGRQPPFPSQPQLTRVLNYSAVLYDGDNKYGQIELLVTDDGDARAKWSGDFQIEGKDYRAVPQVKIPGRKGRYNLFLGNTAPLKIYEDENGQDKSKLYVITQGLFYLKDPNEESSIDGMAYVSCWIDKDYNAEGKLAMPLFANGQVKIFFWGPVEPMEE